MEVVLLFAALGASARTVELFASPATPFNISAVAASLQLQMKSEEIVLVHWIEKETNVQLSAESLAFDYLYNVSLSLALEQQAEDGKFTTMWERDTPEGFEKAVREAEVFAGFLARFNFTSVRIVSNSEPRNQRLAQLSLEVYPTVYRDISIIPEHASLPFCLEYVGRTIKPRGVNLLALFVDDYSASCLLSALEAKKLNKPGYAFFLSQQAALYRFLPNSSSGLLASGTLFVDDVCGSALTREELETCRLALAVRDVEAGEILQREWLLYALNSSRPQLVSFPSLAHILFPGNSTTVPSLSKAKIRTSVNYRMVNPDGSVYPLGLQWMRGYEVAFREANNRTDLIPDYYLEDATVGFVSLAFNFTVSRQRVLAARSELGHVFMSAPSTVGIMGMTNVFRNLSLDIPIVAGSIGSQLSDPKTFPRYIRPRVANAYMFTIICRMIAYFGWQKVAVLYAGDSGDNEDGYARFLDAAAFFGIAILNPEASRKLPTVLSNATTEIVEQALKQIIDLDTRILVVLHGYHYVIQDQMYDLGVREEYVFLLVTGLSDGYYSKPDFYKRRVVSKGALMFFPKVFVGAVGERVFTLLTRIDGKGVFPNTCFFYDAAYLYFHATDFLLERGMDYEDASLIVKSMRETYFTGCSGFFKVESGSNDRVASEITLTNFQYDSEKDTYELKVVGSYNPYSAEPYHFTSPIQWPDNSLEYSDFKPIFGNCPFLARSVRNMNEGKAIAMAVNFFVALLSLGTSLLMWQKWWRRPLILLTEEVPISMEDVLALLIVFCDYFQFAAVGPRLSNLTDFMDRITASFGLNLEKFVDVREGVFWIALDLVLVMVFTWTVLCLLKLTHLDAAVTRVCSSFEYWTELLMPTLGNLLFLPIVSTLSNVFICYKGLSARLTDSFLDKDCSEFCWRKRHLGYAIGSGLGLAVYIPLAIFTRPLWQELQSNVHVKARPLALMVKSAVQITLIVSANTLRSEYPTVHAVLFFSTTSVYIIFLFRVRQFNYDRMNMWHIIVMIAMLLLSVAAFLANQGMPAASLLLGLVLTYVALGCGGLLLQLFVKRFASKLKREKSRDVRGLFTFAFTGGSRAIQGLSDFYTTNGLAKTNMKTDIF